MVFEPAMIRILDIVLSASGLILLGPLMLLVLLLAWLDTGSPLFAQRRVGQNRQPFVLLKFRTMRPAPLRWPRTWPMPASHQD